MKAKLLERKSPFDRSFMVARHSYPYFLDVWHYHSEIELVYITKSQGTRFIGDSIEPFVEGDLIMIGENLPHLWQNDPAFFKEKQEGSAEAYTVHFKRDFAGKEFMDLPELKSISKLLDRATNGLKFEGKARELAFEYMDRLFLAEGVVRFNLLIEFLAVLADETDCQTLSTDGFLLPLHSTGDDRVDKVYSFTFNNFKRNIPLEEVAELVHLNPTAFCRYFKKSTKKTYSRFLNEIRVGYACKLLIEEKLNISEVGYECGFNNLSNFNRQFKNIMDISPSEYLRKHKKHR
ncbi:AraC family transcriptional regulator [Echinicola pacifica]|uniref:AraC family transcriptional regulator n=1 Tax=Echinicola pacifica TaxID=346377 RepID=A0A918UST6_9BACT|nr:AraC family transcriptional regulator [Echinicola pacifica]GGZ31737.1 AraC family transcriptional regulator [Echinicola pacifica]